ncbi:hypothetical protein F4781DRAFT_117723 [Annulohypoxylon bovei var. microspora]|nr:hypothetical protein F4781DRAFT_117723 [Annulohypoxylon bovei var. microspora]
MGNQISTEVKAESDGEEGNLTSSHSSPRSRNSSPRRSPDIVFSSQVHSATPMNRQFPSRSAITSDQYLPAPRHRPTTFNSDIPHTSPSVQDIKHEIPESPDYKQQTSTPGYRFGFKPEKESSDPPDPPLPPHILSDLNTTHDTGDDMDGPSSLGDPPSSKGRQRRRRREKRRKNLQQLASPDLGNNQEDPHSSLHSDNAAIIEPTPSKIRSSKRRKTETPTSQSRKKKRKHDHDKDNIGDNITPFSSLAETLYAGRGQNGDLETDKNGFQDDDAQEQLPNKFEPEPSPEPSLEPSLSHNSISDPNMNDVDSSSESATHSNAVLSDEVKADLAEDDPTSNGGSQPNGLENISSDDDSSSEVAQSDNQDRMVIDGDDLGNEEPEDNKGISDDEQDENIRNGGSSSKSSSAVVDASSDEYHQDDEELPENPQTKDSRPKQNSARKRVVKPTFFERLAEESANGTTVHGSSSPVAGPSRSTGRKQAKISTMLKDNTEDSPGPKTPSQKRSAPTKTTNSGPHELITGPFSDFELRNIAQAVENWRDDHDLTQNEVNTLIQGNPKEVRSHEFWARIVAVCPNRPRQKLINQCRRKFHNFVARGTWSEEQQEELKRVWEEHGNRYAIIGKLINRHPEDVRDRIRNYVVCGDNRRSDPWSVEEEEKLQAIIDDALRVIRERREEGKLNLQEADEDLIDWQRVSELMDRTRSRLQCIQKWKIMNRQGAERGSIDGGAILSVEQIIQKARDEAEAMSSRERYSIVKAVEASDARADSRIPWAKLRSTHLDDRWSRPTIMMAWYRLRHSVPDWNIISLSEIVTQLSKAYRETRNLGFPSGDDYDVDTEYSEMERKIKKMLKVHRAPKTPNIVVKSDDDDSEEEGSSEEEEDETEDNIKNNESDEDEVSQENSQTNKDDQHQENSKVDETSSDESVDEDTSMKDAADAKFRGSVDLGNNVEDESVDRERSTDAPSISNFRKRRVRRDRKRYSSSGRSAKSQPRFQEKPKSTRKIIAESSEGEQEPNNDEELSSDTNASEVESIPAVI